METPLKELLKQKDPRRPPSTFESPQRRLDIRLRIPLLRFAGGQVLRLIRSALLRTFLYLASLASPPRNSTHIKQYLDPGGFDSNQVSALYGTNCMHLPVQNHQNV